MRLSEDKLGGEDGVYVEEGANWTGGFTGNPIVKLLDKFKIQYHFQKFEKYGKLFRQSKVNVSFSCIQEVELVLKFFHSQHQTQTSSKSMQMLQLPNSSARTFHGGRSTMPITASTTRASNGAKPLPL